MNNFETSNKVASKAIRRGQYIVDVQIPRDPATGNVILGDAREQSERCFINLKTSLEAQGSSLRDVVLVQVYLIDVADWGTMNAVWGNFFSEEPFPQRATIITKELALNGLRVEIIATAIAES
jgi:2-iminobutanoate/2-iminopropanoate deaminase